MARKRKVKVAKGVNKSKFYAIKFKKLPFFGSDRFVCVPGSWIIEQLAVTDKVTVAYPKNEAPFVTNNRVKKREECNPNWRRYVGFIKFDSVIFELVHELVEVLNTKKWDGEGEETEIIDPSPEPIGNRQINTNKGDDQREEAPTIDPSPEPVGNRQINTNKVDDQREGAPTIDPSPEPVGNRHINTDRGDDQREEAAIIDPSPEPVENRQLRSTKNPFLLEPLPPVRRPQPNTFIIRARTYRPWKESIPSELADNSDNTANTVPLKHNQTVIIKENRLIQSAVNGETSNEQNTQTISNKTLVDTSVHSLSKLPDEQTPSKPSDGNQRFLVDQDDQLFSDSNGEIEVAEVQSESAEKERAPSKTQTLEQTSRPISSHSGKEKSASMDRNEYEYSLLEARLHEIHYGQSKEVFDAQKTLLSQISDEPTTVNPPSTVNQCPTPIPVSIPCSKQVQGTVGIGSTQENHYYQNSHLEGIKKTIQSTIPYTPGAIDLSPRRQIPVAKRKSSSVNENTPQQKTCRKNVPTKLSLYNNQEAKPLSYARSTVGDVIDQSSYYQRLMNTHTARNLGHIASQQSHFGVEPSELQYVQHRERLQNEISLHTKPRIDQRIYSQNAMTGGYVSENQPNQIYQPSPLHPVFVDARSLVNINQIQMPFSHEFLTGSIDKTHGALAAQEIEFAAQNQLPRNLGNTQIQSPPIYCDPRTVNPLEAKSNSENLQSQEITEERSLALLNTKRIKDRLSKLSRTPIKFFEICGAFSTDSINWQ